MRVKYMTRTCNVCGAKFKTKKYTNTCSKSCLRKSQYIIGRTARHTKKKDYNLLRELWAILWESRILKN